MNEHGGMRKHARGTLITAIAGFSLLITTAANAAITTTTDPAAFGTAVAEGVVPTGGAFSVSYPCVVDDPGTVGTDETKCPQGVSDTPLTGFPTAGSTYGIISTGNIAFADDANTQPGTSFNWGFNDPSIGPDVHDQQIVRIDLPAATTECLAFDFRFLSEEFDEYVDKGYNDAFVAQLDTWAVTIDPTTQAINAPGNFAGGAGDIISVDSSGPSAMSAAAAAGTTYDGATVRLTARAKVTPGTTHSLYLTLFDQGDWIYDTAVFVDNLRYETIDPTKCKSLAVDPAEGTIGVTPLASTPKMAKDYSKLTLPVSCDLPPGEVSCVVSSKAAFVATPGRPMSARAQSLLAGVVLSKPAITTIAADSNGVITLKTTRAGQDAIKAAIKKPGKLRAKARALLKQAQILRSQGKIAAAKLLEAKAAALKKRARRLASKPLGVVKTTITNPGNGVKKVYQTTLKRP